VAAAFLFPTAPYALQVSAPKAVSSTCLMAGLIITDFIGTNNCRETIYARVMKGISLENIIRRPEYLLND
jgi:hypothetical protein